MSTKKAYIILKKEMGEAIKSIAHDKLRNISFLVLILK